MERSIQIEFTPPTEVQKVMAESDLPASEIHGWYPVPSLNPLERRLSVSEFMQKGSIDAFSVIEPMLGNPTLIGSIHQMDFVTGCARQCDTCLAAAVLPSKYFSFESLNRLFSEPHFIDMLQDEIIIGATADIEDHPQGVEVIDMILKKAQKQKLQVFTNYRPADEEKLLQIMALALKYPKRFHLTISLPFNKVETVHHKFRIFMEKHQDIFSKNLYSADQPENNNDFGGYTNYDCISVFDVRKTYGLFMVGRVLKYDTYKKMGAGSITRFEDSNTLFQYRGAVETYFNPDSFWLTVYTTTYESKTAKLYTPLTNTNLEAFKNLKWVHMFPTPPNWPGGKNERSDADVYRLHEEAQKSGAKTMPLDIV